MTHYQRDLSAGQAKQETGGRGKLYQGGEKKKQSIWEMRGMEKKSRWSSIKNTFFTPIGTQPERRKNGRQSPHKAQPVATPHYGSSPAIASGQEDTERGCHDPSISYLRPCPSYHHTQMFYEQRYQDQLELSSEYHHHHDSSPRRPILSPSYDHLSAPPYHSSSPNLSAQALYNHNTTTPSGYQYHNQYYQH